MRRAAEQNESSDHDVDLRVAAENGDVEEGDVAGGPAPLVTTHATNRVGAHGQSGTLARGRRGISGAGQTGALVRERRVDEVSPQEGVP